jgi:hypothetical protein
LLLSNAMALGAIGWSWARASICRVVFNLNPWSS